MKQFNRNSKKTKLAGIAFFTGLIMVIPGVAGFADEADAPAPEVAKTVTLKVDGKTATVATYSDTVGSLLQEHKLSFKTGDYISPTTTTEVNDNAVVTLVHDKKFRVKDGVKKTKRYHQAEVTVADALKQSNIRVRKDDRVKPGLSRMLEAGSLIVVTRVSFKNIVKREAVNFKTKTKKSSRMYKGDKKVLVKGKKGAKRVTYERKRVNGEVKYTHKVKTRMLKRAKTQVVVVGTKARPANTLIGVWRSLAQCESGLNPHIVSSNGLYHGLFQFSVGTWHSVGGAGVPSQASVSEQVKRAKILQARSGWGQWPHCSSALGLR